MKTILRKLVRSPTFAIASVLTLAIGIGANTAIFSVFNSVLLKPLPYDDADQIVSVMHRAPGWGFDLIGQSQAQHFTYLEENRSFERIGMFDVGVVPVTGLSEPEEVVSITMTDGVLPVLRARPLLGRVFGAADDAPGAPETVVLSYRYWQSRFGGDQRIVGQTLRLDGRPREIIGVMRRDFRFLDYDPALYLPMQLDRSQVQIGTWSYIGVARLNPGVSVAAANADLERMIPISFEQFQGGLTLDMMQEAGLGPIVAPMKDFVLGSVGTALWVLLAMVGLVLLIACANVTNLFLVHAEAGRRDMAVRVALGASVMRVAKEFLAESLTLGLAGGAVGLGLGYGGVRLLRFLAPADLPRLDEIVIDPRVALFSLGLSLFAGLLSGMIPLLQYGVPDLTSSLKAGGRGGSSGRERHRLRHALATTQVAIALVLVIGSGLMIRSFQALRSVDPGFAGAEDVLTLRLTLPEAEVPDPEQVALTHVNIARQLERLPGVTSVGSVSSIPMDSRTFDDVVVAVDFPVGEGSMPPLRRHKRVGGDYFKAMDIRLVAGRPLDWSDVLQYADVVVVTESFAEEYWKSADAALGRRIMEWHVGREREIVGVVQDVRDDGVDQPAPAIVYWPIATIAYRGEDLHAERSLTYTIRTERALTADLLSEVQKAVWSVSANIPLVDVSMLDEHVERSMARTSFMLVMLGIAATMAVLLSVIGIYGVISYVVSQRTRELGVRMALGAEQADVQMMVLKQGAFVVLLGGTLGLITAAGASRLMSTLLFGVENVDPFTYGIAAVSVAAAALLASYIPARRAAGVDPSEALRAE
jgi:predicted permease